MRTIPYKDFSLEFHKNNRQNKKSNVCQFELTFKCALHCKHCYSDCYNNTRYLKRELSTEEVKLILDKVYRRDILWLCFTGGDPLTRRDFLELYLYAKNKGFIITLFTNAFSIDKRIAEHLKGGPPFAIEITLNAVTEDLFEKITRVKGSYAKVMRGINLILKARLPLKIKTQVTKDNLAQLPKIKQFIEELGFKFHPASLVHSRLNGDLYPVDLRISPQDVFGLSINNESSIYSCDLSLDYKRNIPHSKLFQCALADTDRIHIDPYGNLVPCNCIRQPKLNLLRLDLEKARQENLNWIRTRYFTNNSKCRKCPIRGICFSCPGRALLEMSDMQAPVPYFCELAHFSVNSSRFIWQGYKNNWKHST